MLINVGGKVLEIVLINRIMHHVYNNSLLNHNQFGFIPNKSAIEAALAVRISRRRNETRTHCNT